MTPAHRINPTRVSANRRFLERADGKPFLWLGDTAWELIHRLTRDEIEHYLETRAAQRFTVVQTVILAERDGLRVPTPEELLPLDLDTLEPKEAYFEKVDWVLERAAAHGLTVALLPTWGDQVQRWWGVDAHIFAPHKNGAARARTYGHFVGARYRDAPNLVWVLGGDRCSSGHPGYPTEGGPEYAQVWRALGEGVREGDGGAHLVTFHPCGGSSSSGQTELRDLLDFDMIQSGHHLDNTPNWQLVRQDHHLEPTRPTLDAEPCYEEMPVDMNPDLGRFTALEVRRTAYHAIFAGAFGHTYGANSVWQFHRSRGDPLWRTGEEGQIHAETPWQDALHLPFAQTQLRVLRGFLERFPPSSFTPDWNAILEPDEGRRRVLALRREDALLVYTPTGEPFTLRDSPRVRRAQWFDPRTAETRDAAVNDTFTPPTLEDWALILERA
jgi:Protein of unknown function (DUF4038)/Putative collagen-binding domain of a collagenase